MLQSKRRIASYVLMMVLLIPILVACGGGSATSTTKPAATTGAAATKPAATTAAAPTTAATTVAVAPTTGATVAVPTSATGGNATATTDSSSATEEPEATPADATEEPEATPADATEEPEATKETGGDTGPAADKTIVIGMTQPPDTLFGIESQSSATTQVLSAIQPACMTTLSYEYQAVCFTKVPNFDDGDAVTKTITVDSSYAGNIVVNDELITDTSTLTEELELVQVEVTFELIDGMTWQDGEPVKASDFVYAAKLYNDPGVKNASRFTLDRTAEVRLDDDKKFTWVGAPGYTDATYFVNYFGPEPEHVLGTMDPAEIGGSEYASNPLAYGPYKVAENVPQESTTLVANETYWRASEGLPKVGNVVFKYLTSEDQVLQQLEGGEIDVVGSIGLTLANAPQLDDLEAAGKIKAQYVPATVWEHVDFGVERGDGVESPFSDVKVRQAVAYAVNRQEIIDKVLFGKTVVMNSFLPEDHWAYPPNGEGLEAYEYDVEKSKALLEEAGWAPGADDILEKDGKPFTVDFYTTEGNATRQAVAQIIQENLKDVGINMNLQFVPGPAVLFKNGEDGILSARKFDMALYAWVSGPDPSTDLYLCDQVPTAENGYAGQNNPGYCNKDYDKAGLASKAETDREKRIPLVIEAQQIWNQDLPTFPLYQRVSVGASAVNVEGLDLNATSQIDFYNIAEWDITK